MGIVERERGTGRSVGRGELMSCGNVLGSVTAHY